MSSPGVSREASPSVHKKSKFTFRHLSQLASYSPSCPLRVIAHIDLDAFYAQCEMVRLGVPEDKPLAVQQWQGLIAINYPARAFAIGRHCTVTEAKKLCPELITQHVATWREGDDKWAYRDDAAANIVTDKVSLDPYRLQSRKILALVKEALPAHLQKVEKASIDEVFLDLSAQVHSVLVDRFPELGAPSPYGDPAEKLPLPPTSALDWQADVLIELDEDAEALAPDWADVAMLIGSEIVRHVRVRVREQLNYTCSAGVANNKLLSKLGSSYKKPNQQTVIRSRAVEHFLSGLKFTKMKNLGGKFGDNVVATFNTDTIRELLSVPKDLMIARLGDEHGQWVYNAIRGIDSSEVNCRTRIKSMLSAKSFRPVITEYEQAVKWLRIFVADIYARLVEEGVLENKRRPRSINLHHRHFAQTRSRQSPIPQGRSLSQEVLFDLSEHLLSQAHAEKMLLPSINLSLSVSGFEDGITGNMGIGGFLLKGEEAQSLRTSVRSSSPVPRPVPSDKGIKRRRVGEGGIERFFARKQLSLDHARDASPCSAIDVTAEGDHHPDVPREEGVPDRCPSHFSPTSSKSAMCPRCRMNFESVQALQNHEDWHLAKDLQAQERVSPVFATGSSGGTSTTASKPIAAASKRTGQTKLETGQRRLNFG